jgi:hypothetical protein
MGKMCSWKLGLALAVALGASIALPAVSRADTFNFTSDHCTGGCVPSGTVTATASGNDLNISVALGDSLAFLSGNGAGIEGSFAFALNGVTSITISNASAGFTGNNGAQTGSSIMMDGLTFSPNGYLLTCDTCSPSAPDGQTLSFSVTSTGLTGAQLLADLQGASNSVISFFAADVVSCKAGVTQCLGGTGTGNGNTGVIDATAAPSAVPLPGAFLLFGTVLVGGLGASGLRKRRQRGPVSVIA